MDQRMMTQATRPFQSVGVGSVAAPDAHPAVILSHISPAAGFGGVAESVGNIVRTWAAEGRRFTLVVSDGSCGSPLTREALDMPPQVTVRLYRAQPPVRLGFGFGAPAAVWAACRSASTVYIAGVGSWPQTLAVAACRLLRRPYMISTHGGLLPAHVDWIRRYKPFKWLFYRLIVFPSLRRALVVRATSGLERDGILALLPNVRVAVVENGVDAAGWHVPDLPPPPGETGLRLCYVGRLSHEKGIRRFLELWLHDRRRPGDRLTIVGSGSGPYARDVEALARAAGDAVTMTGWLGRAEVRRAMGESHFIVLPSGIEENNIRENFGNAVAEALAVGRPVLVRRGLAWDHLPDCGAGLLFDADDASILATIDRARGLGGDAYAAMANSAAAHVARHLALDRTAAEVWSLMFPS